ncbi:adenylate kinase family protein [Saliphagus sp. LR7]|uniref:adenylate kinase family protein n=1 Tax=Saliphagus sp. LR7 TaxID=2282654 RepID=UPI000DF7C14C|nr:adenylate kinase family protein [Saliphagus sp. LR7]
MRLAVTGTPGTGKTTATDLLEREYGIDVVHCNELIENEGISTGVDTDRDSAIVDLDALESRLADREDCVLDSHLAHHLPADRVAVLRCDPEDLEDRLLERGEPEAKARENAESEALDVILAEAVDRHGREAVYEIDTTDREPGAVADEIHAVRQGTRDPSAGTVDFVGYLA